MTKRNDKVVLRSYEYTARPRRTELRDGVQQAYWTVRCRRLGAEGEWTLGWFATRRAAEQVFYDWVSKHRATQLSGGGHDKVRDVVERYIDHVQTMAARPNTVANRTYTAKQLRAFVDARLPGLTIGKFDAKVFDAFREWLTDQGYSPQTVLNSIVGARTLLRWVVGSGLMTEAPKAPKVSVPPRENQPVYADDIAKIIEHADEPVKTLLQLLWETGFRYAEAASMRLSDVDLANKTVRVIKRGDFVPKRDASYRTVPISDELAAKLGGLATAQSDLLFDCPEKCVYAYWRHRFRLAQRAAGIADELTFHDLRRATADRLRRAEVPLDVYCKFMGHAAITGLKHYATVDDDDLRKAHEKAMKGGRTRGHSPAPESV